MDKEKVILGTAAFGSIALFAWWLNSGQFIQMDVDKNCLRKWHQYTVTEDIGHVDDWLALEKCMKLQPKYKELYEKYAAPKLGKTESE